MNFCLAVFRSRTQVLAFIDYMNNAGIACSAVNTPTEAHIGCGISAKFFCMHTGYAKDVISRRGLDSFRGFYHVEKQGIRTQVTRM